MAKRFSCQLRNQVARKTSSLSPYSRIVTCVKYVEKGPCTRYFGPYLSFNRLPQEQKKR